MTALTTVGPMSNPTAAQELLRDSFTRLIEHVEDLTDGLTDEIALFRPTSTANSITWLIWHSARVQDLHGGPAASRGVVAGLPRDGGGDGSHRRVLDSDL